VEDPLQLVRELLVILEDVQPALGGKDDPPAVGIGRLPHASIVPTVRAPRNSLFEARP